MMEAEGVEVTPTGHDLTGTDYDAHVRKEHGGIMVDVFSRDGHVSSDRFPYSPEGAKEAGDFLEDFGIQTHLVLTRHSGGKKHASNSNSNVKSAWRE